MKRKTILIAETNNLLEEKIIKTLKVLENEVIMLKEHPKNSQELLENIIEYKPDIVITNEKKKDYPATDAIQKIQSDLEIYQPTFIILSAYEDMDIVCKEKEIMAYYIKKPFEDKDLVECIRAINQNTILYDNKKVKLLKGINLSEKNREFVTNIIIHNEKLFMNNQEYKAINKRLSDIVEEIDKKLPSTQKLFKEYDRLLSKCYGYENCFLYQFLIHNLQK